MPSELGDRFMRSFLSCSIGERSNVFANLLHAGFEKISAREGSGQYTEAGEPYRTRRHRVIRRVAYCDEGFGLNSSRRSASLRSPERLAALNIGAADGNFAKLKRADYPAVETRAPRGHTWWPREPPAAFAQAFH